MDVKAKLEVVGDAVPVRLLLLARVAVVHFGHPPLGHFITELPVARLCEPGLPAQSLSGLRVKLRRSERTPAMPHARASGAVGREMCHGQLLRAGQQTSKKL